MSDTVHDTDGLDPTETPVDSAASGDPVDLEAPEGAFSPPEVEALGTEPGLLGEEGALRAEFDALNDRHLRLAAEFNNYRRRVEHERVDQWGRAQADVLARFLDVLDDLQRVAALDLSNASVDAIMEGIDLVERKFSRMLGDVGVEIVDPTNGPFDPAIMEAVMRVPAESPEQDDTVAQVFQKGYTLKGQLVRPARVSVHKHD